MALNDLCRQVLSAASTENEAIELDRRGDPAAALVRYESAVKELQSATEMCPKDSSDYPKLVQHRSELLERISHLKSLKGGAPTIALEDQIKAVQLSMQVVNEGSAHVSAAGGVKAFAAVAAVGAGASAIILGSTIGIPLAAVGGAAAAGYCATRSDKVGEAARGIGNLAIAGVDKAMELNEKHKIAEKMIEVGKQGVALAKQTDEKYGITDKVATGVNTAVAKAVEFESKHQVSSKVMSGVASGLDKVSSALDSVSATKSEK